MSIYTIFRGALVRRLFLLYLMLGLIPIIALVMIPMLYLWVTRTRLTIDALLLQFLVQSAGFVLVVLVGGFVTFRQLALPIQELAKGAQAIADGKLSYRVPDQGTDDELLSLVQAFNSMAEAVEMMREDIQNQKNTLEHTLAEREKEFAAINELAALSNRHGDLKSRLKRALEIIREALGVDILTLFLSESGSDLTPVACTCDDQILESVQRHLAARPDVDLMERAVRTQRPVKAEDVDWTQLSSELRKSYADMNVARVASMPIVIKGKTLGVLNLMRQPTNAVPAQKIALLGAMAEQMGLLIENVQLQDHARALSIMEERRRLASELHDSVTQSLFTLSLTAKGLKAVLRDVSEPIMRPLDVLIDQTKVVQTEMRTLINELRPVELDQEKLDEALRRHAKSLGYSVNVKTSVQIDGDVTVLPVSIQRSLNRIAQEALSNVARHANAQQVDISLKVQDALVSLSVKDDGSGFDPQEAFTGESDSLGLLSMRERAELMGGVLVLRSLPGEGTTITVKVPLPVNVTENSDG